jgi:hypothetical protein
MVDSRLLVALWRLGVVEILPEPIGEGVVLDVQRLCTLGASWESVANRKRRSRKGVFLVSG